MRLPAHNIILRSNHLSHTSSITSQILHICEHLSLLYNKQQYHDFDTVNIFLNNGHHMYSIIIILNSENGHKPCMITILLYSSHSHTYLLSQPIKLSVFHLILTVIAN